MHGGGDARREHSWITRMAAEYGHDEDILRCPADRSALRRTVLPGEDEADVGPVRHTSYATNFYVAAGGIDNPLYGRDGHAYNRLDWIRHPASTIHFVELAEEGDYALADHVHPENWDAYFPEERAVAAEQVMLDRHQRAANYGLIDGHVERLKYEQTYQIHEDFYGAAGEILWLQNKYDPTVAR
jgi:prepilin-type processing-associated H-X9-DG protein